MIAFACSHCGVKIKVNEQFAGRHGNCPTCKQPIVVPPAEVTKAYVPQGAIDGTASSLDQTGVRVDITLEGLDTKLKSGQKPVQELLADRTQGQRYVVADEIGRGGMGAVLRAVDCDIRREVAVKFLLNQADAKAKGRFVEEAQITGQLEHPNIPPVHELGIDAQKRLFFAMKMVKGRSLAQVLDQLRQTPRAGEKEWPLIRLLNVIVNICNALAYAHSRGVIHRDLKPANIMVGDFGEVYVMDWGLAKVLKSRDREGAEPSPLPDGRGSCHSGKVVISREPDIDMTQQGSVLGTPVYMPPEQAMGKIDALDERSDIYSLGAILYEILTLLPPVEKEGGYLAVLMNVSEGKIVPPEQRMPQRASRIPKELSAITMKALAKEQKNRYANVEALRKDLERFQEGRSVSAKEDTKREMIWKFVKRNKGFSAAVAVAVPVVLLLLIWSSVTNYQAAAVAKDREKRTEKAVPALVDAARLQVEHPKENGLDKALEQLAVALDYKPNDAAGLLLKGQVLIVKLDFAGAVAALEKYLGLRPDDAPAKKLMELCRAKKPNDPGNLLKIAQVFEQQKSPALADLLLTRHGRNSFEARQKLLELYRQRIEAAWPGLGAKLNVDAAGIYDLNLGNCQQVTLLDPLEGMPLSRLSLHSCEGLRNLSPLKGMPLTWLQLDGCQLRDLSPLKGIPLTWLSLHNCRLIGDLSPLKGMQLDTLNLGGPCDYVRDLGPLKGMPLTRLYLAGHEGGRSVPDLSPLDGMKLWEIELPTHEVSRGMTVLRRMKTLTKINGMPAADFWQQYDAGKYPQYKK